MVDVYVAVEEHLQNLGQEVAPGKVPKPTVKAF